MRDKEVDMCGMREPTGGWMRDRYEAHEREA